MGTTTRITLLLLSALDQQGVGHAQLRYALHSLYRTDHYRPRWAAPILETMIDLEFENIGWNNSRQCALSPLEIRVYSAHCGSGARRRALPMAARIAIALGAHDNPVFHFGDARRGPGDALGLLALDP